MLFYQSSQEKCNPFSEALKVRQKKNKNKSSMELNVNSQPCGANNFLLKFEDTQKKVFAVEMANGVQSRHSAPTVQMEMEKEINI